MPGERPPEPWLSFFDELDSRLSEPVSLHCLGGFVVIHVYGVARTTNDCDFIGLLPVGSRTALLRLAGKDSPLHRKYRLFLDAVTVANCPDDYETRLKPIFEDRWQFLRLFALEAHDLALSKLERNYERDRDDVQRLAAAGRINPKVLRERYKKELRGYLAKPEREDLTLDSVASAARQIAQRTTCPRARNSMSAGTGLRFNKSAPSYRHPGSNGLLNLNLLPRAGDLMLGDGFRGQVANNRQGIGFVVAGLDDHHQGHQQEDCLDDAAHVEVRHSHEHGLQNPVVDQVGDKEVKPLECVEANDPVVAKAFRRQDHDRANPADPRDVAKHRSRSRGDAGKGIGGTRRGVRLLSAAFGAVNVRRVHLISALAAKRHP